MRASALTTFTEQEQAKENLRLDATLVYVAAPHAAGAIEEAIEAEIPLIVAVAEHIPLHDMLRVGLGLEIYIHLER